MNEGDTKKIIAVFIPDHPGDRYVIHEMLEEIQSEMTRHGYSFMWYQISRADVENKRLPAFFHKERIAAVVCFEMLDPDYAYEIEKLDVPTLFVDAPSAGKCRDLKADCLLPESRHAMELLAESVLEEGKTKIGFIGEKLWSRSFLERFRNLKSALAAHKIPFEKKYQILNKNTVVLRLLCDGDRRYLKGRIARLEELPEVFVCANDTIAVATVQVLQEMGVSVPEKIWVCGFGDAPEARVLTPSITTVQVPVRRMGSMAAEMLLSRIENPEQDYRIVYADTVLIWRESAEKHMNK